ncbi:unnamed protein product [Symbiodinium sp. KB8]|nr:unnamed protein product [Symbiodinium sp. KB8]
MSNSRPQEMPGSTGSGLAVSRVHTERSDGSSRSRAGQAGSDGLGKGNSGDAASHGRKSDASDFFSSLVEPATSSGGRLRMGENMMPPTSSAPWWSQPRLRAAARTVPTRATAGNSGIAASHGRKSDASDFFSSLVDDATSPGGRSHSSNQVMLPPATLPQQAESVVQNGVELVMAEDRQSTSRGSAEVVGKGTAGGTAATGGTKISIATSVQAHRLRQMAENFIDRRHTAEIDELLQEAMDSLRSDSEHYFDVHEEGCIKSLTIAFVAVYKPYVNLKDEDMLGTLEDGRMKVVTRLLVIALLALKRDLGLFPTTSMALQVAIPDLVLVRLLLPILLLLLMTLSLHA